MKASIRSVRGMNDIFPEDAAVWQGSEAAARDCFARYGYGEIRTPIVEKTELFKRQLGEHTDLVEKEMYTFPIGASQESLTLRPEATVSTMRALLQDGALSGQQKSRLYYIGPMFRHERPQQGRYRQFHQIGAEAVGFSGPGIDVEMVAMCRRLWEELGIGRSLSLEVNNLGDATERKAYLADLAEYFRGYEKDLDADSRRRIETNPLRILDSKDEHTREVAQGAPRFDGCLGRESLDFFERFSDGLESLGISFKRNHSLVRGLDYYSKAVYEWVFAAEGKDLTLCGGGRYDGLAEQIGAKPTPGCGFAIGTERLIGLVRAAGTFSASAFCDAFLVFDGEKKIAGSAARLAEELRDSGVRVCMDPDGGSFKSLLRKADASGAVFALLLGKDEDSADEVSVKPLRDAREQFRIGKKQLASKLKELLDK